MTPKDVLNTLKEKNIKFLDLRFSDTRGKEQHVTLPSHAIDEDFFKNGKMWFTENYGHLAGVTTIYSSCEKSK